MTLLEMSADYRHSADLLRGRIRALRALARQHPEDPDLDARLRALTALYRDTHELADHLEHYYDKEGRHARWIL